MAVLGRSRSGPPPDQILDPPLFMDWYFPTKQSLINPNLSDSAAVCHTEI